MPDDDSTLVDRVRAGLSPYEPVREVSMFGGLSFMVDDRLVVSVRGDGDLLVRADPGRADSLLTRPGARTAEMGAGRVMSKSWISVSGEALETDEEFDFWMGVALDHHDKQGHAAGKRRRPA